MNQNAQLEVWTIELSNFLIKNHKYQLITLNQETQEVWLMNRENKLYPIIMISTLPVSQFNQVEIMTHRNALGMFTSSSGEGLNISVYPDFTESDEVNVVIGTEKVSSQQVAEQFKGIEKVLQSSDNPTRARFKALQNLKKNLQRSQKKQALKTTWVTSVLTLLLIGAYFFTGYFSVQNNIGHSTSLVMLGAYYKPLIVNANEWWRFLTPMFLHADFIHLFMNLLAMNNIARIMEKELGSWRYLVTIILGVIFGSGFLYVRNENVIGIGISAGIYALLGVLIIYLYENHLLKNKAILSSVLSTLFMNVIISMLPGVSFTAHLGGLFVGVFLGFIFSKRKDWDLIRKMSWFFLITTSAMLIYGIVTKSYPIEPSALDLDVIQTWHRIGFDKYAERLLRAFTMQ